MWEFAKIAISTVAAGVAVTALIGAAFNQLVKRESHGVVTKASPPKQELPEKKDEFATSGHAKAI
jgi:hypothetical protein